MRPLRDMQLIQVEVTNACTRRCANCTRLVGHHKTPFFMDLQDVRRAFESLVDFPGHIGIMGGEPTLHPQFPMILHLLRKIIPDRRRCELWTAGHRWAEYREDIERTFDSDLIAYNEHKDPNGKHHPLLVAAEDVIHETRWMRELIDRCWVQERWSASITPKGAFFCEVAAAMDHAFGGPGGWLVKPGWWDVGPGDERFEEQKNRWCRRCSAALPLPQVSDKPGPDIVSRGNLFALKLAGSPKALAGRTILFRKKEYTREHYDHFRKEVPQNYRSYQAHGPEDEKEGRDG